MSDDEITRYTAHFGPPTGGPYADDVVHISADRFRRCPKSGTWVLVRKATTDEARGEQRFFGGAAPPGHASAYAAAHALCVRALEAVLKVERDLARQRARLSVVEAHLRGMDGGGDE